MTTIETYIKRSNPNELSVRLGIKLLAVIVSLTLAIGLLLGGVSAAFAASTLSNKTLAPTQDILVQTEHIRLGDVFEGVSKNSGFVLAPAPGPGEELVWNKPTLLRIATAFNLPWRPENGDEVRIRRAATLIDADTIRAVIRDHLASEKPDQLFEISLTGKTPRMIMPGDTVSQITLADFNMQLGGTFSAIVQARANNGVSRELTVRGVAQHVLQLPVLRSDFQYGDIIGQNDITYITMNALHANPNALRDADKLIGSTPRRFVRAGKIVRIDDVQKPQMVARGDTVLMVFKKGPMAITSQGRALEDGAMGQTIKVSNTGSNRMVKAVVTNTKEVTIGF